MVEETLEKVSPFVFSDGGVLFENRPTSVADIRDQSRVSVGMGIHIPLINKLALEATIAKAIKYTQDDTQNLCLFQLNVSE